MSIYNDFEVISEKNYLVSSIFLMKNFYFSGIGSQTQFEYQPYRNTTRFCLKSQGITKRNSSQNNG